MKTILAITLFATVLILGTGCGAQAGAMAYFMGAGAGETVDAQFTLDEEGPILVLVDDPQEKLEMPETRNHIAEKVGKELLLKKVTAKVVSNDALKLRRRIEENFDKLSVRQVGERLEAKQVIWIEVRKYDASNTIAGSTASAKIEVTVKVIDPEGTKKDDTIRLWPQEVNGYPVSAEVGTGQLSMEQQRKDLIEEIAEGLADSITKLFYEHSLEESSLRE